MIYVYRDVNKIRNKTYSTLYNIIQYIDNRVQEYAEMAYDINSLNQDNKKLNQWRNAANIYLETGIQSMLNAMYGYAVEELVNLHINAGYNTRIYGYRLLLQVTHGNTRPDIVIEDGCHEEIAWLDITSEDNAEHIYLKDGRGWRTAEFVAELLYKPLDTSKIMQSSGAGIGSRVRTLSISRRASIHNRHILEHMITNLNIVFRNLSQTGRFTKADIASEIEGVFKYYFVSHRKHPAIKSMFKKYLEIYPNNYYSGFIREILNAFYKNDRYDIALAMRFISDSYEEEKRVRRIFED